MTSCHSPSVAEKWLERQEVLRVWSPAATRGSDPDVSITGGAGSNQFSKDPGTYSYNHFTLEVALCLGSHIHKAYLKVLVSGLPWTIPVGPHDNPVRWTP